MKINYCLHFSTSYYSWVKQLKMSAIQNKGGVSLMDMKTFEDIASSQYVWAIICFIMVYFSVKFFKGHLDDLRKSSESREQKVYELYEDHRKESIDRENRLMAHLEKTGDTLISIEKSLSNLDERIDSGFSEVWKYIAIQKPGKE
jgi:hypothetical protein